MLRAVSTSSRNLRQGSRLLGISSHHHPASSFGVATNKAWIPAGPSSSSSSSSSSNHNVQSIMLRGSMQNQWTRSLSSQSNSGGGGEQQEKAKTEGGADDETKEIVLTPGQQVVAASRLTMWVGMLGFGLACAYFIGKELIPTKMSPNTVFNGASKVIRNHPVVTRQFGESLKFYGKDHGGHREGRRNFIEHTEYTDPDDGSKRTRVRFNMEGQFATAFCFAEVSSAMPSGEFVYVLVQDKRTGQVITVIDNRAALTAQRLAGGNKESASAMQQLLSGGSKSN